MLAEPMVITLRVVYRLAMPVCEYVFKTGCAIWGGSNFKKLALNKLSGRMGSDLS